MISTASRTLPAALLHRASSAWSQQPNLIKFSHVVASSTPKGQAADLSQSLIENDDAIHQESAVLGYKYQSGRTT